MGYEFFVHLNKNMFAVNIYTAEKIDWRVKIVAQNESAYHDGGSGGVFKNPYRVHRNTESKLFRFSKSDFVSLSNLMYTC